MTVHFSGVFADDNDNYSAGTMELMQDPWTNFTGFVEIHDGPHVVFEYSIQCPVEEVFDLQKALNRKANFTFEFSIKSAIDAAKRY